MPSSSKPQTGPGIFVWRLETADAIARDKVSPRCTVCKNTMSAYCGSVLGHTMHICCAPQGRPDRLEIRESARIMREFRASRPPVFWPEGVPA